MLGYFAAKNDIFWYSVKRAFLPVVVLVIVLALAGVLVEIFESQLEQSWAARIPFIDEIIDTLDILYAWSSIVALLGAGQRWLNRPSRVLIYLTGAVFCYYILHQTIIIIAGYYLTGLSVGAWPEFLLVALITIVGCAVGYEIFRRIPVLRLAFGIKSTRPVSSTGLAAPAAA